MKVILNSTIFYNSKHISGCIFALSIKKDLIQYRNDKLEYTFESPNNFNIRIIVLRDKKISNIADLEYDLSKKTNFQKKIIIKDYPITFKFIFSFSEKFSFEEVESLKGSSEKLKPIQIDLIYHSLKTDDSKSNLENLKKLLEEILLKNKENEDKFLSIAEKVLEKRKLLIQTFEKYSSKLNKVNDEINTLKDQFSLLEFKEFNQIELKKGRKQIENNNKIISIKEKEIYNNFVKWNSFKK